MKTSALLLLALAGSVANAAVVYDASTQTGFRYNAGQAGTTSPADNRRTAFDDVNFSDAAVGANTAIEVTRVTVGIRRLASVEATDVRISWATLTPGPVAPDTELDLPASVIGTTSLAANGAASVTQLVSFGDGTTPIFIAPLSTIFTGFKSFAIGLNLSSTSGNQGWRITNGPSANGNVFWQHDPFLTGQPNPEAAFLFDGTNNPPNPPATFYIIVEGNFVPTPGAAALLGLGGMIAGRRRRA